MYWVYDLPNWLFELITVSPAGGRFVGFGRKISVSPEPLPQVYRQRVNPRPCTRQMQ